ncbi:MAG: SNF2-related protein [Prochlorothrix sp.]
MAFLLPDHPWRISYASDTGNPIAEFYIPALERSVQYDRKSGFFNSSILSRVASGLGAMLHNDGQIRLVLGCHLSPQDLEAIRQGYALRDAIAQRLDADLTPPQNFAQLKRFEILSWLIQADRLDIRIAIPLKRDGSPQGLAETLDFNHIYHEKVCIFTDAEGNQVVTNGSSNESASGWEHNIESFQVNCSWEGARDLERVQEEVVRFERLWTDQMPGVRSFAMPDAIRQKLLRYSPSQRPTWTPQQEFDTSPLPASAPETIPIATPASQSPDPTPQPPDSALTPTVDPAVDPTQDQALLERLRSLPQDPGCLSFCLDSIPIQPWPHQLKILRRVAAEFPRSYLIADEVGLGKTIETGLILRYLWVAQKAKRILILAPASVQPQWHSELREKFNLHFWSYNQGQFTDPFGKTTPPQPNPWNTHNLILASSHLVRRQERMDELLAAEPWDLVVVDEAHHARRKMPQQRKDTPNRLLELLRSLKAQTQAMLLLSATPMQIDPIEVFDLLHILGLQNHWAYGENFCDYFATLPQEADDQLLRFWQVMSSDYFQQGGQPCPRLQATLQEQDRMLAYSLEDVWTGKSPLVQTHPYLQNEAFLNASRQYLSLNTPLKDLMFRHTRDTLRQYYRRGLLHKDIPTRAVIDHAICLEPDREAELYRQVSDYVRHFYRLAQKENRKALGFLMTLYRKRLTSSFYAMRESLQRRLEALQQQRGSGLTDDDLLELEDADDSVIQGMEAYLEPVHPKEIEYLEQLLRQFEQTGEDSKFSHLLTVLRQAFSSQDSAIIFTQYTDTMDFLRQELVQLYGRQLACYSGRGGEVYQSGAWAIVPKERIKHQFREGTLKLLLCTESASEGLNLQTCGVLLNYDMPWNPMRVEQRIGRIDRIGQVYPQVSIHNFYYDGTVEAKVYRRLRDRIDAFTSVVGNLQPILAQVPTFIEKALSSADPEEEDVLFSEFEDILDTPPLQVAVDDLVHRDVEADVAELQRPLPPTPLAWADLEHHFTTSPTLQNHGFHFRRRDDRQVWQLRGPESLPPILREVTFNPALFGDQPSLQFLSPGDPLFHQLVQVLTQESRGWVRPAEP